MTLKAPTLGPEHFHTAFIVLSSVTVPCTFEDGLNVSGEVRVNSKFMKGAVSVLGPSFSKSDSSTGDNPALCRQPHLCLSLGWTHIPGLVPLTASFLIESPGS